MHSLEHMRKKAEAREEALHHYHNSAVDGMRNEKPEGAEAGARRDVYHAEPPRYQGND